MQKLSKFIIFVFFFVLLFSSPYSLVPTSAQVPRIGFPCDDTDSPEFHSLRPYQAAACGDAGKARYCSNDLEFIESFDVTGRTGGGVDCTAQGREGTFTCNPNLTVKEHDLTVDLDNSMF